MSIYWITFYIVLLNLLRLHLKHDHDDTCMVVFFIFNKYICAFIVWPYILHLMIMKSDPRWRLASIVLYLQPWLVVHVNEHCW